MYHSAQVSERKKQSNRETTARLTKASNYIEKEIRKEENGMEIIQLVSIPRERKMSGEIQELDIREGAISQANVSMISSAVQLLESSEIFRPYESQPPPQDEKQERIQLPELILPLPKRRVSPVSRDVLFHSPLQKPIKFDHNEVHDQKSEPSLENSMKPEAKGLETIEEKWELQQEVVQKILQWKLPVWTIVNLENDLNGSGDFVERLIKEYKRFIALHYLESCVYSHFIKIVWEYHLAETQSYHEFCFKTVGYFIHSMHLPRNVTFQLQESYSRTLHLYETVFKEKPPEQIWPPTEYRFDYDSIYSYKFFNIRGYMSEIINKVEKRRREERKQRQYLVYRGMERAEMRERKKSIANMRISESPQRGKQYIEMASPTQALFEGIETEQTEI